MPTNANLRKIENALSSIRLTNSPNLLLTTVSGILVTLGSADEWTSEVIDGVTDALNTLAEYAGLPAAGSEDSLTFYRKANGWTATDFADAENDGMDPFTSRSH